MSTKTKTISGWMLTGVLAMVIISSASMKLMGGEAAEQGAAAMGLSLSSLRMIGIVEVLSLILFIVPRTGILGTLMMSAYLGGAIVTHLLQGQPFLVPLILQCVLWITAVIRFPELTNRIVTAKLYKRPLEV